MNYPDSLTGYHTFQGPTMPNFFTVFKNRKFVHNTNTRNIFYYYLSPLSLLRNLHMLKDSWMRAEYLYSKSIFWWSLSLRYFNVTGTPFMEQQRSEFQVKPIRQFLTFFCQPLCIKYNKQAMPVYTSLLSKHQYTPVYTKKAMPV